MGGIVPEVGQWLTVKTEFPWDSEAGKVISVDLKQRTFRARFACEPDFDGPSFEDAATHSFQDIQRIITDEQSVADFEKEYGEAHRP
ncbi:MAG TPA: hypothetical protein VK254_02465 [Candidatus Bathyarchaeia archaeon]|nr:hypothetical protein [Candidatus Bathyarchaeia archaeon]